MTSARSVVTFSRANLVQLAACLLALFSLALPAKAQTGIPTIPTVELTETSAGNALNAYRELHETFDGQELTDNDPRSVAQAMMLHNAAQSIVTSHGFADPNEWHTTLISFVLAYGVIREGNLEKMKTSIAQLEATPGLPEETKNQMMDQMRALIPSDNNIAVTKAVSANPDFADVLQQLQ